MTSEEFFSQKKNLLKVNRVKPSSQICHKQHLESIPSIWERNILSLNISQLIRHTTHSNKIDEMLYDQNMALMMVQVSLAIEHALMDYNQLYGNDCVYLKKNSMTPIRYVWILKYSDEEVKKDISLVKIIIELLHDNFLLATTKKFVNEKNQFS